MRQNNSADNTIPPDRAQQRLKHDRAHAAEARSDARAWPTWALFVALALLLLASMAYTRAVHAEPAGAPQAAGQLKPRLVSLGDMQTGALLLKTAKDGEFVEAPRLVSDVEIDVSGPVARARVTQRFQNPANGWVEGIYVFPLPDGAAVDSLRMQIGDRFIEGIIKGREEARHIYEEARAAGKKASLLEQERPNMFTNSVANIGPGETVVVQIEYQETVRQSDGVFSLRFPMVVAPRYAPKPLVHTVDFGKDGGRDSGRNSGWGNVSDPVPDRDRITPPVQHPGLGGINPVSLQVRIAAGFPLGEVESHHHKISLKRTGEDGAILALAEGEEPANRDFELTWTARQGAAPSAGLFRETAGGEDYMLLFVTPARLAQKDSQALPAKPREIIFVIDNSGSMGGESMVQAKDSLLYALDRLGPQDRFNIIRFDDTMSMLFPGAVAGDANNIAHARGFVRGLDAQGGTEMLPALRAALIDPNASDGNTLRQVVFLTDGAIGNEEQLFAEIIGNRGRSRIFTVGIGSAPNSFFMTRAAQAGRGTFTHIGSVAQVKQRMTELFTKLENPVLTDLRITWSGGTPADVSPDPLPDLYAGEPVVLTARAAALSGTLTLEGMLNGQPWIVTVPVDKAQDGTGIAKLWARRMIESIEALRYARSEPATADKAILDLALRHHLVSRVTSLVAVDVTPSRPEGEQVTARDMAVNLPKGWNFEKVFGGQKDAAPRQRDAMAPTPAMSDVAMLVAASPTPPRAAAATLRQQLLLPPGATLAGRHIMLGLLLILFAGMCVLTGLLWRRAGRTYGASGANQRG